MTEQLKKCSGCDRILPILLFNGSPNSKAFKKARCKQCDSIYNKDYYLLRKEKMKIFKQQYPSNYSN
ncbi:hypothetical protein EDE11_10732 [Methylomonas methanica]|uniref:Uncharacterized protein n=1 Tax=Methylomonas methanica TaxID=421 RepID=A0ABY2CMQ4_METMH|nr:hypothetical protein EDE11_10732 [Methylomonas methanica]